MSSSLSHKEKKNRIGHFKKIPEAMLEIINLNVGGKRFTTSKSTLCSVSDTFFTAMLMGGIPTSRDDSGAIFIDRDPDLFAIILNYLRTNKLHNVNEHNFDSLMDEAKFFSITPLVKKLELRENMMSAQTCGGNILFESLLKSNQSSEVKQMIPFDRGLAVVFNHFIKFYFFSDNNGWKCVFDFEYNSDEIELVDFVLESSSVRQFLIAIYSKEIILWKNGENLHNNNQYNDPYNDPYRPRRVPIEIDKFIEIGHYNLKNCRVDSLFFIRSQLVTLCKKKGRIGIWKNSRLFEQDLKENDTVSVITAFNKTMMDYLFLYPDGEEITAISCLCSDCWRFNLNHCSHCPIEIAYGTKSGTVHILVQNPETQFQEPQLFRTIRVHLSPIWKIMLDHEYLMTMCTKLHVRTWSLVRFRGMISTQPGLKPQSNFAIRYSGHSLDNLHDIGPYGHQEGLKQVFVEIPYSDCNYANIIYASNGQKICTLESVDGSKITSVCGLSIDIRDRRFIFTGHENGNVQVWDLNPAMKRKIKENRPNDKNRSSSRPSSSISENESDHSNFDDE
ncbi:hypothetical protein HUG17_1665 [Dermatophagoides farinae]|uniref:BTB domain-containing protein n=1 Tax=Dermatophagoides farinae TaxID=6954 RepID=A0A9D4P8P1_DERFA|nr:hypothetical protein HUG17_1665 [Dermatophagoides farinae]